MPLPQQQSLPLEDSTDHEELPNLSRATSAPTPSQPSPGVSIPLDDVTHVVEEVNQPAQAQLTDEVQAKVNAVLRQGTELSHRATREEVQANNERMKRDFTEQVLAARHQAAQPPPPPQPMAPAMAERTRREMAEGARQSAVWAEQQKSRPLPNARDVAAAGHTTPVFAPATYTHEKGEGFEGKQYQKSSTPGR